MDIVAVVHTVTQQLVMVVETEVVTQPIQKVTEVVVVQTMAVFSNGTVSNEPALARHNGTRASNGLHAPHARPTAAENALPLASGMV